MLQQLLGLKELPKTDSTDGLAAVCHFSILKSGWNKSYSLGCFCETE
jgi:hypothetical protein